MDVAAIITALNYGNNNYDTIQAVKEVDLNTHVLVKRRWTDTEIEYIFINNLPYLTLLSHNLPTAEQRDIWIQHIQPNVISKRLHVIQRKVPTVSTTDDMFVFFFFTNDHEILFYSILNMTTIPLRTGFIRLDFDKFIKTNQQNMILKQSDLCKQIEDEYLPTVLYGLIAEYVIGFI